MSHLVALVPTWHDFDIEYRLHSTRRMFERDITEKDIENLLVNGSIIEEYPDDYPLPSILLNGHTVKSKPLHVVIAINEPQQKLVVITTYIPDLNKWMENFSRRKL